MENSAYIQLSSSVDQTPPSTAPTAVTFSDVFTSANIHHTTERPSEITVAGDGVYFVVSAGQVGRRSGSLLRQCDMWFSVNGADVQNTGVRCSAPASLFAGDTTVLVSQIVIPLKKNDVLRVMVSVSSADEGLGLITFRPLNQPIIPSIIFSMYRI